MMISRDENCSRSLILNDSTVIVSDDHVKVLGVVIDNKLNILLHMLAQSVKKGLSSTKCIGQNI